MLDVNNLLTANRFKNPSPVAGATDLEYRLTADQLESAFEQLETSVCKECIFIAPTISPPDTSDLTHSMGYLEHPRDVFAYYRAKHVDFLFAQEKLMGSRATISAVRGSPETSQIWSRSGRPFFDRQTTTEIMIDVLKDLEYMMPYNYSACLLDTEAMPWSLKSGKLGNKVFRRSAQAAKNHYDRLQARADVRAAFHAGPDEVKKNVLDAKDINQREHNASQMLSLIDLYLPDNQYPIRDATFHVFDVLAISLEGEGAPTDVFEMQQPAFSVQFIINQMGMHQMRRLRPVKTWLVDLRSEESCEFITQQWMSYTNSLGGEGFVFKTREYTIDPTTKQFIIPAMKCRGREYMRLTYGVNYTEPESFKLFKGRSTSRKRMLSAVEYQLALGGLLARQTLADLMFEERSTHTDRQVESLEDTMYIAKLHVLACEQDKKIDIRL